jgi:hypothetical protein
MPQRIQRKRTKGWRMPSNTVYVGRPTMYGNPFRVGEILSDGLQAWVYEAALKNGIDRSKPLTGPQVMALYLAYTEINKGLFLFEQMLKTLRDKDLACWCKLDAPCHADILLKLASS